MALPDSSMILLLPVGTEYSTVDEATKDAFVSFQFAVVADKQLLCHWLYNAKTITVRTEIGGGTPSDVTETLRAGDLPSGLLATDHPFPANYITSGVFGNPTIGAESNNLRWVPDPGEYAINFFYVFVFEGIWYWTPGIVLADQAVSILDYTSFIITGHADALDFDPITITYTITDTFY